MNLPAIYEPTGGVPQVLTERGASTYPLSHDQITVRYLLAMLRRRREVLGLTLALCLAVALVWTTAQPRIYRASADVLMITRSTAVVPEDGSGEKDGPTRAEDVETQVQLIRSREMARQVLDSTGLLRDNAFRADLLTPRTAIDNVMSTLGFGRGIEAAALPHSAQHLRERAITYLVKRIDVSRTGNSYTLRIAFADVDADRSALVANTYARLFTTDDARERARTNATAANVLQSRVDELRQSANKAFAAVQGYRVRTGLLSSAATSLTEQEISTYNQQIAVARAEAAQDAAALGAARAQLRSGGADRVGEAGSQVAANLRAQRAELAIKERDLSERYFDGNPDLVTVRRQITDIDSQIGADVDRSVKSLELRAQSSAQRLSSLLASRSGTRAQLGADNGALVTLADLEKRAQAAQALYQSYLERYNGVVAGSGSEQPTARLISAANVPILPESPDLVLNLGLGLIVGVLLGAMLAVVAELSYRGLTTLDDVESKLGLRGLGSIPNFRTIEPHSGSPLETVREHPDGAFSEALRNVIVSIRQSGVGTGKVVAVTSAVPGEGKSTVAACMGRALAMANERVAVIDCDVIRAQLSKQFGFTSGEPGLYEALRAESGEIAHYEELDSPMRVVPITRVFGKGERLTERGRLHGVVARLREDFDVIILDCPPILPIAESREIVSLADHAVLVVRWRGTIDRVIQTAVRQLSVRTIKHLGVVLNQVDMRRQVRFGGSDVASFYEHYRGYYA